MINHFRSVLLNEPAGDLPSSPVAYTPYSVHIDPTYTEASLPTDIAKVYSLLFPSAVFESKLYLADSYLKLIRACNLDEAVTNLDSRITYDLTVDDSFFSTSIYSTGLPQFTPPTGTWVRLYNFSLANVELGTTTDISLELQQTGTGKDKVRIMNGATQWLAATTLTFDDHDISQLITVVDPITTKKAFDFNLYYPGGASAFTVASGKKWTIYIALPAMVTLKNRYNSLISNLVHITPVLKKYKSVLPTASYDNLWQQHFNWNYRLAGLVIGLVYRINSL